MNLLFGLVVGVLAYFVSLLVFNQVIAALIGIVVGMVAAFGADHYSNRL